MFLRRSSSFRCSWRSPPLWLRSRQTLTSPGRRCLAQHRASMSTPNTTPTAGSGGLKMVAGYALERRLGSGSFATVYRGVKVLDSTGRTEFSAIKAISRSSEKLTKKVLENLELEISILRTYRHPNIVCLYDVQKTERHVYLILEYCAGGDVQQLIRSRKTGRLSERFHSGHLASNPGGCK